MNTYQQHETDISKVFTFVRAQLQAKEKELLELQRADRCLLVLDSEQIDVLVGAIACLQLSTQDGSFVFAPTTDCNETECYPSGCSTDWNSIKTLPSNVWLPQSTPVTQRRLSMVGHLLSLPVEAYLPSSGSSSSSPDTTATTQNQFLHQSTSVKQQPSMVDHLLSLPVEAYLPSSGSSSSSPDTTAKTQNQFFHQSTPVKQQPSMFGHLLSLPVEAYLASSDPPSFDTTVKTQSRFFRRNSMANHLLSMPINSFKPSSNTCTSNKIGNYKNLQNDMLPTTERKIESALNTETMFSKQYWLRNS